MITMAWIGFATVCIVAVVALAMVVGWIDVRASYNRKCPHCGKSMHDKVPS